MKFSQLNEKAKQKAIESTYTEVQEHYICWESEYKWIEDGIKEILEKYNCEQENIDFEYQNGRAYFGEEEVSFDDKVFVEREELIELKDELSEMTNYLGELCVSICSNKTEVSYYVDYELGKYLEERWEFIKKYASELKIDIKKLELELMFGSDLEDKEEEIKEIFEEVLKGLGSILTEYLTPKIDKMRVEIVKIIEQTYGYLESYKCVYDYLEDCPDEFNFDEEGYLISEEVA